MPDWLLWTITVLLAIALIVREINGIFASRQIKRRFDAAEKKFDAAERHFDVALTAKDSQIEVLREQCRSLEKQKASSVIAKYVETVAGFDSLLERSRQETTAMENEIADLKAQRSDNKEEIAKKQAQLAELREKTHAVQLAWPKPAEYTPTPEFGAMSLADKLAQLASLLDSDGDSDDDDADDEQ